VSALEDAGTIRIGVRVYASLRRYAPAMAVGQALRLELPAGATIGDALAALGIPAGEAKACFVAHVRRELDYPLSDGDELAVFPPVAGGCGPAWAGNRTV